MRGRFKKKKKKKKTFRGKGLAMEGKRGEE